MYFGRNQARPAASRAEPTSLGSSTLDAGIAQGSAESTAHRARRGRARGISLALQGIFKQFGATPALHGIDLAADQGEFLALLGPSGSGKTTLLRMIAGLEAADRGRVLIGGVDNSGVPMRKKASNFIVLLLILYNSS